MLFGHHEWEERLYITELQGSWVVFKRQEEVAYIDSVNKLIKSSLGQAWSDQMLSVVQGQCAGKEKKTVHPYFSWWANDCAWHVYGTK